MGARSSFFFEFVFFAFLMLLLVFGFYFESLFLLFFFPLLFFLSFNAAAFCGFVICFSSFLVSCGKEACYLSGFSLGNLTIKSPHHFPLRGPFLKTADK